MTSRLYPALLIRWPTADGPIDDELMGRVLAGIDDEQPIAVEEQADNASVRIFFSSNEARARAAELVRSIAPNAACETVDVPDERWAERSQASIGPIHVGRIVVRPPWVPVDTTDISIVIEPSMGFGTGHHASTRLCLALMQTISFREATVLDVGTGSGVLAIAASRLGAAHVTAIDFDLDALTSARENVELNQVENVELANIDLGAMGDRAAQPFSAVIANLTGAVIVRLAGSLAELVRPDGHLIVSGITTDEADDVTEALAGTALRLEARRDEDGWVGLLLER